MKLLSRDFTTREKALMLVLCVLLIVFAYYNFVDQPVRQAVDNAAAERDALVTELTAVQLRVARLNRMQAELEEIDAAGSLRPMGVYNNSKAELALLNDILSETVQYTISFSDVTREGDQIRRNFALQFTSQNHAAMQRTIQKLAESEYRCLIGNIACAAADPNDPNGAVSVQAAATFFETLAGGTPDAGLPQDSSAAQ